MIKVLLTGSTGLLGTNLVNVLTKEGFGVKALARNPNDYHGIKQPSVELVKAELTDDLNPLLNDCDYVVHSAAYTGQDLTEYQQYQKVNVDGTIRLLKAAKKNGIKKFIFISSANTLAYGDKENPGTEAYEMIPPFNKSFYALSKLEAEQNVLKFKDDFETVILNPTFMLGADDYKPSSGKIIQMSLHKKIIFCPPGGKNFVHVEDVAQSVVQAFKFAKSGDKFLIANENMTYAAFFEKLNQIAGQKALLIKLPKTLLRIIGFAGDLIRLIGLKSNLSSVNMHILCINPFYSNKKSIKQLKINYRSVDMAIEDAVNFFKKQQLK